MRQLALTVIDLFLKDPAGLIGGDSLIATASSRTETHPTYGFYAGVPECRP